MYIAIMMIALIIAHITVIVIMIKDPHGREIIKAIRRESERREKKNRKISLK